ncbi:MAG TPA: DUF1992 domain-containing protein [Acidimicrobiia bacterium]|jgi:hypothetical protein|nr:DUF1992 domain-containing protein [Acidimicrobiia bacterium]
MSDEPPPSPDRKPPKMRWETWVERKIRESMERGEFDNLPGAGRPLPDLDRPYDELWWLRKKLRDEKFSIEPPVLELRRQFDETRARIAAAPSEAEVRRLVTAINQRIVYVNSHTTSGPATELVPLDVERVVAQWRLNQGEATAGGGSAAGSAG